MKKKSVTTTKEKIETRTKQRDKLEKLKKENRKERMKESNLCYRSGIKKGTHSEIALRNLKKMTGKTQIDIVRDSLVFYYLALKREFKDE